MEVNAEIVNLDSPVSDRKKDEFRDHLIESIEEVLSFSEVVLNFLERNTAFKKATILDDPMIFSRELEDFFGASASGIEKLIIEKLYDKIKQKKRMERGKAFDTCISEALTCFLEPF
jgi:hypothetical protein